MAWTAPRTWVTSELVTSTIGNTHWRDNFLFLVGMEKNTSKEVTNSVTETDMLNGDLTLTGGRMQAGMVLRWYAYGDYLHNQNVATTYTFRSYFGATAIAGPGISPSINGFQNATRGNWWMDGITHFVSTTSQWSRFRLTFSLAAAPGGGTEAGLPTTVWFGSSAVDTSTDQILKFTAACSTASALEAFRLQQAHVRTKP